MKKKSSILLDLPSVAEDPKQARAEAEASDEALGASLMQTFTKGIDYARSIQAKASTMSIEELEASKDELQKILAEPLPTLDPAYEEALVSGMVAMIETHAAAIQQNTLLTAGEVSHAFTKTIAAVQEEAYSTVAWFKESGFFTTAPVASRDAGIAALVVFESESQLRRNIDLLEGGIDPCWIGCFVPIGEKIEAQFLLTEPRSTLLTETDDRPQERRRIAILGRSARGLQIREQKGETFVEIESQSKSKRPRVHARTIDGGNVVQLMGADGRVEEKIDLATFVRRREHKRQRADSALVLSRADALMRSTTSSSYTKLHESETRKTIKATLNTENLGPLDNRASNLWGEWLVRGNPAEAYEISVALTDASRRRIADIEAYENRRKKKKKTLVEVRQSDLLPFDETKLEISPRGISREQLEEGIADRFMETITRSLTPSLMQTILAVFSLAIESPDGSVVQNIDALLRLRGAIDGGKQRSKLIEELSTLGFLQFRLSIKDSRPREGDKIVGRWKDYTILQCNKAGVIMRDGREIATAARWSIGKEFFALIQTRRSLAVIDKSLFSLDSVKEEWEFKLGVAIATRWSKGWLGDSHFSEDNGSVTWKVQSLVDNAGLGLVARGWIENRGKASFRDRFRQALEKLQRCGESSAEAIGHFEIKKDRTDPLLDLVTVAPTPGAVEVFRSRVIGRAEAKALPRLGKA